MLLTVTNWLVSNPEVHYRPYMGLPLDPIMIKVYPISSITSFKSILILSSRLRYGLPKNLFPSGLPTKTLYAFLDSSMGATCPAHLSCLYLRFLIMLDEKTVH